MNHLFTFTCSSTLSDPLRPVLLDNGSHHSGPGSPQISRAHKRERNSALLPTFSTNFAFLDYTRSSSPSDYPRTSFLDLHIDGILIVRLDRKFHKLI
ncbi:hypothetical protein R3P38DRAFT_3176752 [Favolaschia claudopus]|uniref:Uncharacterized protein n=1 Tax=Favolaschia claudopus TaxID=2862362 RepID=A0AAW0CWB5_9AGAR